jgi:hypothetical protein
MHNNILYIPARVEMYNPDNPENYYALRILYSTSIIR